MIESHSFILICRVLVVVAYMIFVSYQLSPREVFAFQGCGKPSIQKVSKGRFYVYFVENPDIFPVRMGKIKIFRESAGDYIPFEEREFDGNSFISFENVSPGNYMMKFERVHGIWDYETQYFEVGIRKSKKVYYLPLSTHSSVMRHCKVFIYKNHGL